MVPASVVEFVFAALDGARCPDGSRMAAVRAGDATVLATSRGVFRVVVVPADDEAGRFERRVAAAIPEALDYLPERWEARDRIARAIVERVLAAADDEGPEAA